LEDDVGEISAELTEKVNEYKIMSTPIEQAMSELEYARELIKARVEHDIAQTVPALGALAEILDISSLDMLMAPDQTAFVHGAMLRLGLSAEEVGQRMRALVASQQSRDELKALGLPEHIS
jgi:hypothetical protein